VTQGIQLKAGATNGAKDSNIDSIVTRNRVDHY
jgi:hypothetical protein